MSEPYEGLQEVDPERDALSPGESYQDILDRDTRDVPEVLRWRSARELPVVQVPPFPDQLTQCGRFGFVLRSDTDYQGTVGSRIRRHQTVERQSTTRPFPDCGIHQPRVHFQSAQHLPLSRNASSLWSWWSSLVLSHRTLVRCLGRN